MTPIFTVYPYQASDVMLTIICQLQPSPILSR
jgi:hypothetical protein